MEISEDLMCLFTAHVEKRDDGHVIEVPAEEIELGELTPGETYRAAILPSPDEESSEDDQRDARQQSRSDPPAPPVEEGDHREVVIESLGDQGDGIAKVERGFVIIVEGADIGDEVLVEITNVAGSFAIGEVVEEGALSDGPF
jgi:predicted RNA-binding protein with TRAM domain